MYSSDYKATLEVEWVPRLLIKSQDRTRQIKIETIRGQTLANTQREFKFSSETEHLREPKDKWNGYTGKLIFANEEDRQRFENRMGELGANLEHGGRGMKEPSAPPLPSTQEPTYNYCPTSHDVGFA